MEGRLSIPAGMERQSQRDAETFRRSAPWHADIDGLGLGGGGAAADCRERAQRPDGQRAGRPTRRNQGQLLLALRRPVRAACGGAGPLGTTHTTETMRGLDAVADYRRRLELILDAAFQPPRARSLYAALAEAAEDPIVGAVLNRVATARIAYLELCYRNLGLSAAVARSQAVFAYAAYRGLLQLAHEAPGSLPTEWSTYPTVARKALLSGVEGPRRARQKNRA